MCLWHAAPSILVLALEFIGADRPIGLREGAIRIRAALHAARLETEPRVVVGGAVVELHALDALPSLVVAHVEEPAALLSQALHAPAGRGIAHPEAWRGAARARHAIDAQPVDGVTHLIQWTYRALLRRRGIAAERTLAAPRVAEEVGCRGAARGAGLTLFALRRITSRWRAWLGRLGLGRSARAASATTTRAASVAPPRVDR